MSRAWCRGAEVSAVYDSLSTDVRPRRSYGIELGVEIIGADSVRYDIAGVVIPLLSTLLVAVELLQVSCGWLHAVGGEQSMLFFKGVDG